MMAAKKHAPGPQFLPMTSFLFKAQGGRCFHCLKPMDRNPIRRKNPNGWTREHVVPRFDGGGRSGNLVLAHELCNMRRGLQELSEIDKRRAKLIIAAAKLMHSSQVGWKK